MKVSLTASSIFITSALLSATTTVHGFTLPSSCGSSSSLKMSPNNNNNNNNNINNVDIDIDIDRMMNRRSVFQKTLSGAALGAFMFSSSSSPANAAVDCFTDCLKNCKLVAPKDPGYCNENCKEYCDQPDREDGLSGSISSKKGETGILGTTTVVKGEDKPPSIRLPGLDFNSDKGKKLIGY